MLAGLPAAASYRTLAHDEHRIDRKVRAGRELTKDAALAAAVEAIAAAVKRLSQRGAWLRLREGMNVRACVCEVLLITMIVTTKQPVYFVSAAEGAKESAAIVFRLEGVRKSPRSRMEQEPSEGKIANFRFGCSSLIRSQRRHLAFTRIV